MSRRSVTTSSEEETFAVAARLAASLAPGSVVLLFGDLGAGKTAFVRGMAAGLGLDPAEVSSPTFTLVQEYNPGIGDEQREGRDATALHHVDLYRLEGAEIEDLGLEELIASGGVTAIEWADKLRRPISGAVRVRITEEGEEGRRIEIQEDDSGAHLG